LPDLQYLYQYRKAYENVYDKPIKDQEWDVWMAQKTLCKEGKDLNNLMNSLINEDKMIKTISKGYQLTIPADLRNELGMTIGSKVDIEKKNNTLIIKPIAKDTMKEMFNEVNRMKTMNVTPSKVVNMKREVYK